MTEEQYIEHEIRLRVIDEKFKSIDERMGRMQHKYDGIIATGASSIIIPIILHYFGII